MRGGAGLLSTRIGSSLGPHVSATVPLTHLSCLPHPRTHVTTGLARARPENSESEPLGRAGLVRCTLCVQGCVAWCQRWGMSRWLHASCIARDRFLGHPFNTRWRLQRNTTAHAPTHHDTLSSVGVLAAVGRVRSVLDRSQLRATACRCMARAQVAVPVETKRPGFFMHSSRTDTLA